MDITRRGFLKGALGLAGAGMTGALTVPALKSLLPPPVTRCNEDDAHATLTYKSESGKWYESKGGETAKASDFKNIWDVAIVDTTIMAYHTYKCPHLCCKPVFTAEGTSTISGNDYENMFLCPCHLSLFDPVSIIPNIDEMGREVMAAELLEGPAPYGLPVVPVAEEDGGLIGLTTNLDWLKYCGQG